MPRAAKQPKPPAVPVPNEAEVTEQIVAACRMLGLEVVIPDWRPPTLNQLMRGKLKARMRLGRATRDLVAVYCLKAGVPKATGKRRVSLRITLGPRQRPCDVDAPWKATLDALKSCGAILDDSWASCELGRLTFDKGARPSTAILLEDVNP